MDKKNKILIGLGLIIFLIGGHFLYQHFRFVTTDNAQVAGHTLLMSPKVSGYVTQVTFEEGQKVKAGELLVEIDPRDYKNRLSEAQGQLQSTEAKFKDVEKNTKRLSDLLAKNAVSQQQFDTMNSNFNELKALLKMRQAEVALAELNLENTQILAPSDGFIAKKGVEKGLLAAPGMPLIGFVDSSERWVVANFKETQVKDIAVNAQVEIEVDAITHKTFLGTVENIGPATGATFTLLPPDNATGNFTKVVQRVPVKIKLKQLSPEDIQLLRVGLSVLVKVSI